MTSLDRIRRACFTGISCGLAFAAVSCASLPPKQFEGDVYSRLHADFVPAKSHRLLGVVQLFTRKEIEEIKNAKTGKNKTVYDNLIDSGIPDSKIVDHSVAAGITVCCGGEISRDLAVFFYVPDPSAVEKGDIVEIEVGDGRTFKSPNILHAVRQKKDEPGRCDWHPKKPYLWLRVLYCEGMEKEGWKRQKGDPGFWVKPPESKQRP